ncbi:hypothetical protein PLESTB_001185000 [Pleodorina starrii]|uniref:ANK_REP_REGION domain-containing protein n=1 Tax=Pleodorina starrii TaxID=330485 RepID=A0A9W6BRG7_9CHLO|nr:hypothetical protein PLESTB_001185000 [Pleodorina starrii]
MGNILATEAAALFDAIAEGDVDTAVRALESHPGLSHKRAGKKNRTIYHACASSGQVEVLRRLCEHVWAHVPDELGKTHPGGAGPEGRFHPVLYRAVNSYDESGLTPLMLACKKGHAGAVQYLISQGADPWVGDRLLGRSALHHAARANHHSCIEAIVTSPFTSLEGKIRSKECKLVDYPNNSGYTPLHYAASTRSAEAAAALFRHGADPNAKTFEVGFDFIQLDRGCTPLHAAARFQNLDMVMALLRYWDEALRRREVTDPRVVENYERVKPYQVAGVKTNKALARVLDPSTPIKEISDPFGEAYGKQPQMHGTPFGKVVPVKGQGRQGSEASCDSGWGSGDKLQAPAGWEDVLLAKSVAGAKGRTGGSEFVTVYRCAEYVADYGTSPPAGVSPASASAASAAPTAAAAPGRGLLRAHSDGRHGAMSRGLTSMSATAATAGALGRTRSGAVPGVFGGRPSANPSPISSSDNDDTGVVRVRHAAPAAAAATAAITVSASQLPYSADSGSDGDDVAARPCKSPPLAAATPAPSASPFASAAQSPTSAEWQLPSPSRMRPATPQGWDLPSPAGFLKAARSSRGFDGAAATATASGGTIPAAKPPSPDASKLFGRSITRSSSRKRAASGGDAAAAAASGGSVPTSRVGSPTSGSGSGSGSASGAPTTATTAAAPPPSFLAWSDNPLAAAALASRNSRSSSSASSSASASTSPNNGASPRVAAVGAASKHAALATAAAPPPPDFTRDSHAADAEPVEVTMYPHTRVNLERLKAGETSNTLEAERRPRGAERRRRSGEGVHGRRVGGGSPTGLKSTPPAAPAAAPPPAAAGYGRQGRMPAAADQLSEDESQVECLGAAAKALSPAASRRRVMG